MKHCKASIVVHLLIVGLSAFSVLFRKFFLLLMSSSLFPTSSLIRFMVFGFMSRFLIHLMLSFVKGDNMELLGFFYI